MDLKGLAEHDGARLRKVSNAQGGEWAGAPCPVCGGGTRDAFHVQPSWAKGDKMGRWLCGCCTGRKWEDAPAYVMRRDGVGYLDALQVLGMEAPERSEPRPPELPPAVDPPSPTWQARAAAFVAYAQGVLWSDAGRPGLEYLRRRGLADDVIRAAGLGYNRREVQDAPTHWGLEGDGEADRVTLRAGVVVPAQVDGAIWYVKVRQLRATADKYKYLHVKGGRGVALYNADALRPGRPAVLVEGELDALAVAQAAADLAVPVATGTAEGAHGLKWLARLSLAAPVLVALDADDAGDAAATWWLTPLGERAIRWRPRSAKDPGELLQRDGAEGLRRWIAQGLAVAAAPCEACRAAELYRFTPDGRGLCAACYAAQVDALEVA